MTVLAPNINLCSCIKQQANNVNITSNCRDMKRGIIKQSTRRNSREFITEGNKLRQIFNLAQETL